MTGHDKRMTGGSERDAPIGTVSVRTLLLLVRGLEKAGLDGRAFLRERGIDPALLEQEDQRVPVTLLEGIWDLAAGLSKDPLFALHVASGVQEHSFGLFSYIAITSETWGKALERVCKYFQLVSEVGRYESWVAADRATLGFVPASPGVLRSPQLCDFLLAVPFSYASQVVPEFQLVEVLLPYPAPATPSGHESFFRAPVRFSAPTLALTFPARLLSVPQRKGDSRLVALLEEFARAQLATMPAPSDALGQVRQAVREATRAGEFTLEGAARRLAVTPRTLQRKLADAGTTFKAEIDQARRLLAVSLVAQPQLSLHEIAFVLGFSEPAPFHRAFRRWTGSTPGSYRADRHARPSPQ
jgi:AraC-like DNA-binding protein